jgi:hypothetical protein
VKPKAAPLTPSPIALRDALRGSSPLARLRAALDDSNARFATVRSAFPAAMLDQVRPGPVDEEGWSLLAANAAVAAKLRQLRPRFELLLQEAGWAPATVRIKVLRP